MPRRKKKDNGEFGSLVLADLHFPYEDPGVLEAALRFGDAMQPRVIHLLGDIIDFYALSRFSKDPNRKSGLADEVAQTVSFLSELRERFPDAEIRYSEGNHENRLQRYLWSQAPELESLPALKVPALLELEQHGMSWHPLSEPYDIGDLTFHHGSLVRKWSGWSAKAHYEKYHRSIIIGHAHRLGSFYIRQDDDLVGAFECPCLCDLSPEYDLFPDWANGWSYITHSQDGRFMVEQIPVIKGYYHFRGKTTKV